MQGTIFIGASATLIIALCCYALVWHAPPGKPTTKRYYLRIYEVPIDKLCESLLKYGTPPIPELDQFGKLPLPHELAPKNQRVLPIIACSYCPMRLFSNSFRPVL